MIDTLRDHLRLNAAFTGTPALLCITGAQPPALAIDARLLPRIAFDSLGIPTDDEMTRCWEAPRAWQKMMTYHWVYTARQIYRMRPLVVLEGQFDPQYAIAACASYRVRNHVILVDVGDPAMAAWAENARSLGGTVVDGRAAPDAVVAAICTVAMELLATQ
jgi:hypothetical protein